MKKYRKKPIVIEAIQFTRNNIEDVRVFCKDNLINIAIDRHIKGVASAMIHTLEGPYHVIEGDYIIKGTQGEFYPCKEKIFKKTYEEVLDE